MRAKSVAWFFAGFATGMLVIAVALWAGGRLHTSAAPSPPAAARSKSPVPLPEAAPLPDTGASRLPPPAVQVPPAAPEADRQSPDNAPATELAARHLLVPVEGVHPQDLVDTFDDARAQGRQHEAIDIMASRGTPVIAADEGNVVKLFTSKQGGLTVYQFDNSRTWCYYYAHLDRYEPGLKEGRAAPQRRAPRLRGLHRRRLARRPAPALRHHPPGPRKAVVGRHGHQPVPAPRPLSCSSIAFRVARSTFSTIFS